MVYLPILFNFLLETDALIYQLRLLINKDFA